ncbi:MAG TPA: LytTR family DNA-binding domain-containing protein [Puia sp.]
MNIRCLIIDDEPLAVRLVSSYCARVPQLEVVATCSNAIEALPILKGTRVDLLFLDIKMPRMLGTEFLRSLPDPPRVIFITAYREYAFDGYDLDIVDYLLKPLSFARFMKAVAKADRFLPVAVPDYAQGADGGRLSAPFLYFRVDKEMVKVILDDILFIESRREYAMLFLQNKRTLLVKQSISSLEKMLSPHRFVRVHRSYVVTTIRVESFTASQLRIGDRVIPIGRLYKARTEEVLKK